MVAATPSNSRSSVLTTSSSSPSLQILPFQRYIERMPGRMLTQAAWRRATISRAMRLACSSVPTVVTTTIARMPATLLHSLGGSQSRESFPPHLLLGVVGEHAHLAGAVEDSHHRQAFDAVGEIERAGRRGAERTEGGEVRLIETDRIVEVVQRPRRRGAAADRRSCAAAAALRARADRPGSRARR